MSKVYIISQLDHAETIKIGPGKFDNISMPPKSRRGPVEKKNIQLPLPKGIRLVNASGG